MANDAPRALIERLPENPLIRPEDVPPSRPGLDVLCAFNAAAIRTNDEILLLLRVAERPKAGDMPEDAVILDLTTRAPTTIPAKAAPRSVAGYVAFSVLD